VISKLRFRVLLGCSFLFFWLYTQAAADPLSFTVLNSPLITTPGGSAVTFEGNITNNTGGVLNTANLDLFFNFANFNAAAVNPPNSILLENGQDFTIANGQTSPLVDLFSVSLTSSAGPGTTYFIDATLQDVNSDLFTERSSVMASSGTTPVPEPATAVLIGTGVVAAIVRRRNHCHRKSTG
jgi:hypothetical protein